MEDELWKPLYQLLVQESKRRSRRKGLRFSDASILVVFLWAVLHDRPISWACCLRHWPPDQRWRLLPSPATMSRRMRTVSVIGLLEGLLLRLGEVIPPALVCNVDAKPLPVGGFSKDIDAKWGQAVDAKAKGYKFFNIWSGRSLVPEQWRLGPMSCSEPLVAEVMVPALEGCGYLLGDSMYDTNSLHQLCDDRGIQLLTPRKRPGTQLGHKTHASSRLRSIDLLENHPRMPLPQGTPGTDCCLNFGPSLYACRIAIEQHYGHLTSFGGGLAPLPSWVRRPHRVAVWVAAKLVINALRICRNQRVTL